MKKADSIGGILFFCFGLLIFSHAWQMDYWSKNGPETGFLPLWCSVIMSLSGLGLSVQAYFRRERSSKTKVNDKNARLIIVAAVAALTMAAIAALDYFGFCVSVFLFMLILFRGIGHHTWRMSFGVAAVLTTAYYITFKVLLDIPLPSGWIGS